MKSKYFVYAAALILPGGLIALGLWKAYEYNKKKEVKDEATVTTK